MLDSVVNTSYVMYCIRLVNSDSKIFRFLFIQVSAGIFQAHLALLIYIHAHRDIA